jgi:hypothetical protein
LQEALLNCIDSVMAEQDLHPQGPFQEALMVQAHMGWLSMLQRYWSQELQQAYKQKNKRKLQMARRQKKFIQIMWGSMITLWTLHNDKCHGWDKETCNRSWTEMLHHKLADVYNSKHQYPI